MLSVLSSAVRIALKDLRLEARSKEMVVAMTVFAVLAVVTFGFALDLRQDIAAVVGPGVLWVVLVFAGFIGLNRSMAVEKDKGCLEALLLAPVPRGSLYCGKVLGNLILMVGVEIVTVPVLAGLLDLALFRLEIVCMLLLGTLGIAALGTLFSAIAVNTRMRDVLLPILMLPALVPVVLAGVKSTESILAGGTWSDIGAWMQLLLAFDIAIGVVSYILFEYVIQE